MWSTVVTSGNAHAAHKVWPADSDYVKEAALTLENTAMQICVS